MVLANPLKTQTSLLAGFGGRQLVWQRCARVRGERRCRRVATSSFGNRPSVRVVPFGRGVPFGGRLLTTTGSPLADQPVEIVETFAAGASRPAARPSCGPRRTASSSPAWPLAQAAASKRRFPGNRTLTRSGSRGVALDVRAGVRLRASTGSAPIGGAAGRLRRPHRALCDASIPADWPAGRARSSEYPEATGREFRTVQTDGSGRFRYAYEFSDDDSRGIRFQFRAFAPAQDGWPYEPAVSRPVSVTGR